MKEYTITVNQKVYQVTVEEGFTAGADRAAAPVVSAPAAAVPVPAAPVAAASAASAGSGSVAVNASVPGKILRIEAKVGQKLQSGDPIVILEAMKMEIPVVAPQAGTLTSVEVVAGDTIENGALIATMN
ncbi:MAG: biotin/lipoyl-containing protein [Lachnospiraceae bacterium]|nr:acetyl-CoA carboxylase biotin carboxyl carrier protein subunit [Lachnospiraceae bacterium]MDY5742024.1 biotin/lipoyl-containing protein [Lachnospiraceae bacterium]